MISKRLFFSPTIMSWMSIIMRTLSVAAIIPLITKYFSTVETALAFLFFTILGMQMMLDLGFSGTFSRVISYAMAGSKKIDDLRKVNIYGVNSNPNFLIVEKIYFTMRKVYFILSLVWCLFLIFIGSWFVRDLIDQLDNPYDGWYAWIIIIITSSIRLYGIQFSALLLGKNMVSQLKVIESFIYFLILISGFLTITFQGGFLYYVCITQSFFILDVFIKWFFSVYSGSKHILESKNKGFDKKIFSQIYPSAWRTGLAVAIGLIIPYGTGVFYAKVGSPEEISSYLFALNLARILNQISQAPFYSKIPMMAKLRALGEFKKQLNVAKRGMILAYFSLISGIIFCGLTVDTILKYIDSNTLFVSFELWCLLGIATFLERFGAMHLQLYSTTNHIVAHIANGMTGIIYILIIIPIYNFFGVYALPISQIISYFFWYTWYCARKSYSLFNLSFLNFELKTSILPFIILLLYTCLFYFL